MLDPKLKPHVVPTPSPSIIKVPTLPEAFAAVEAEILAVPLPMLVPIRVDVPAVTRSVMGAIDELATLLPELSRLPDYDLSQVLYLYLYAGAALHAHLVSKTIDARHLRARAFTLFAYAHDEALRGVAYLRWYEGDWDRFLPWCGKRSPRALMSPCAWARLAEKTWPDGKGVTMH